MNVVLQVIHNFTDNPGDQSYADVICKPGMEYYCKRVMQLGLIGAENVLDIGCGFGQWSFALAYFNKNVLGVDPTPKRIEIAKKVSETFDIRNVRFEVARFEQLQIADQSLDIIFCYGVFMFLNRIDFERFCQKKLKPDGKVYICTNSFGWWLHLLLKNIYKRNFSGAKTCIDAIMHVFFEGYPNSTSTFRLKKIFSRQNWEVQGVDSEGFVSTSNSFQMPLSSYRHKFLGFRMVIEGLFKKKPTTLESADLALFQLKESLDTKTSECLADNLYLQKANSIQKESSFLEQMRVFKLATRLDRFGQLQYIFSRFNHLSNPDEKATQILFFLQKHFIHSFSGQPLMINKISIFCPITVFLLRNVRCGNSARFVVDLFLSCGWKARIIQFGIHICAEVFWNKKWHLFDVDIFDYGHFPKNDQNDWASLEEVIQKPELLDQVSSYQFAKQETTKDFMGIFSQSECDTLFDEFKQVLKASSAYFANETYSGRTKILRVEKQMNFDAWNQDVMFGWKEVKTVEELNIPYVQRDFQAIY